MQQQQTDQPRTLNALSSENFLAVGDNLESPGGRYQLSMQEDGNLVIYKNNEGGKRAWSSRATNMP